MTWSSEMSGGSVEAGWYPDPASPGAKRWWDGTSWTSDVAPAVDHQIRRPPTAPPSSPGTVPPSGPHDAPNPRGFAGSPSPWASTPPTTEIPGPPPAPPAPYSPFIPYSPPVEPPSVAASTFSEPVVPPYAGSPFNQPQGSGGVPYGIPGLTGMARPKPTFAQANHQSLITMGVAAGYVAVAMFAHIVFLGIVPFLAGVRAVQRREPLAALAMAVAVGFVGISLLLLR